MVCCLLISNISTHFNSDLIFPTIQRSHQDVEEPPRFPIREPPSPRKTVTVRPKGQLETLPTGGSDSSSSESTTSIKVFFTCCGGSSCDYYPPHRQKCSRMNVPCFQGPFFFNGKVQANSNHQVFSGDVVSFQQEHLWLLCYFCSLFWWGFTRKYLLDFGFFLWLKFTGLCRFSSSTGGVTIRFHQLGWLEVSDAHADPARLKRHKDVITYSKQKTRRVNNKHMNFLRPPILPLSFWVLLWQKYHVYHVYICLSFSSVQTLASLCPTLSLASCARAAWRKPHGHSPGIGWELAPEVN